MLHTYTTFNKFEIFAEEKFVKKMKETNVDVEFIEFKGIGINTSKSEKNETNVVST